MSARIYITIFFSNQESKFHLISIFKFGDALFDADRLFIIEQPTYAKYSTKDQEKINPLREYG